MEMKLLRFKHGLSCPYCDGRQIAVWHDHLDETRKLQQGMGEQRLFITGVRLPALLPLLMDA